LKFDNKYKKGKKDSILFKLIVIKMAMEVTSVEMTGLNARSVTDLVRMCGFSKWKSSQYNDLVKKILLGGFGVGLTDPEEARKRA
jgi:hypothetical protein